MKQTQPTGKNTAVFPRKDSKTLLHTPCHEKSTCSGSHLVTGDRSCETPHYPVSFQDTKLLLLEPFHRAPRKGQSNLLDEHD